MKIEERGVLSAFSQSNYYFLIIRCPIDQAKLSCACVAYLKHPNAYRTEEDAQTQQDAEDLHIAEICQRREG